CLYVIFKLFSFLYIVAFVCFLFMLHYPTRSTLFPYTTLFRSSELTWNTFRNHLILEYEIVKYDGDLGAPNLFVHLNESIARKKIDRKSTRLNSSHEWISYAVFCLKKKTIIHKKKM